MAFYNSSKPILQTAFLVFCFASFTAMSRELIERKTTLWERLKLDEEEGTTSCWDSLFELQSCTGEVVLFFLNGETYLGPNCCNAIRTIEHHCWPTMLGAVGINSEESDILLGYCDASENNSPSPPQPVNQTSHVMNP
ncbi:hypothetical protein ACH5RR_028287 [Cinchona calisaya]|uniref:Prolamin-like domain-containing protein n=1 Tax=Cinchona calisaya TaxID=153742 RepID=A0ABD2YQJ2_9GENT